jgi:hypothetical protein
MIPDRTGAEDARACAVRRFCVRACDPFPRACPREEGLWGTAAAARQRMVIQIFAPSFARYYAAQKGTMRLVGR